MLRFTLKPLRVALMALTVYLASVQVVEAQKHSSPAIRVTIAPEKSVARYRVREQLAGLDFPSDAVGETKDVSGTVALTPEGKVVPEQSRIVVDLRNLTSDQARRDGYIKRNTLEINQFPTVTFVLREIRGLPWPAPTQGEAKLQLVGDLTVRDQTKRVTWESTARLTPTGVSGTAKTQFTFSDFGMEKPSVFLVLSVNDDIRLELDFTASRVQ